MCPCVTNLFLVFLSACTSGHALRSIVRVARVSSCRCAAATSHILSQPTVTRAPAGGGHVVARGAKGKRRCPPHAQYRAHKCMHKRTRMGAFERALPSHRTTTQLTAVSSHVCSFARSGAASGAAERRSPTRHTASVVQGPRGSATSRDVSARAPRITESVGSCMHACDCVFA